MEITLEETIKDVRKQCRLAMNGVVSTSMRQQGLTYKLNFGVSLNKVKEIATRYTPDATLAESLWKEDVRELKIMATMLYPLSDFGQIRANEWLQGIKNQEIREQICLHLFQNLPFAQELVAEWSNSADDDARTTGYWLCSRIFLSRKNLSLSLDTFTYIFADAKATNISLRNAALSALKMLGRQNENTANFILKAIESSYDRTQTLENEVYESLKFEFEFYLDKE